MTKALETFVLNEELDEANRTRRNQAVVDTVTRMQWICNHNWAKPFIGPLDRILCLWPYNPAKSLWNRWRVDARARFEAASDPVLSLEYTFDAGNIWTAIGAGGTPPYYTIEPPESWLGIVSAVSNWGATLPLDGITTATWIGLRFNSVVEWGYSYVIGSFLYDSAEDPF